MMLLLLVSEAWARAGGGHAYSSGGSGGGYSGGGGSGGGEELVNLLIWLLIQHPAIGVPLTLVVIVVAVVNKSRQGQSQRVVVHGRPQPTRQGPSLAALRAVDPNFSEPLFLDLARLVYVRAHEERGRGHSELLDAYVEPTARRQLEALTGRTARVGAEVGAVEDVVIGTSSVIRAELGGGVARLTVQFQANLTEEGRKRLVIERWTFARAAGVHSPGPEAMRALACPACGSTVEELRDGRCPNCGTIRTDGRRQWRVERVERLSAREVPAVELALGGGVEAGTELPTVQAPDLGAQMRALQARDPSFNWLAFEDRARHVFVRVQEAWGSMRQGDARPYETDFLYQQHRYWIDRYRAEGLRNRVEDTRVRTVQPSRVTLDAYVESITVRIEASMLDWTEDATGRVVGGSRTERKVFSEYWTFVRTAGRPHGAPKSPGGCPSCGAPLDRVSASGVCGYCDAHITSGDYDWVLSTIDQDEAYRG